MEAGHSEVDGHISKWTVHVIENQNLEVDGLISKKWTVFWIWMIEFLIAH